MFGPNIDISASLSQILMSRCFKLTAGPGSSLWCQILAAWSIVMLVMIRDACDDQGCLWWSGMLVMIRDDTCSMLPASHHQTCHESTVFMVDLNVNMKHIRWDPSIVTTSSWTMTISDYQLAAYLRSPHGPHVMMCVTPCDQWSGHHRMSHVVPGSVPSYLDIPSLI